MGRPHSADKKFVRARGPQNWNPEVFDQTRCSRILHVEFPLNNRELVKAEVFEKRVFEQTTPIQIEKMKGAFSLNNPLVGTARPPDNNFFVRKHCQRVIMHVYDSLHETAQLKAAMVVVDSSLFPTTLGCAPTTFAIRWERKIHHVM